MYVYYTYAIKCVCSRRRLFNSSSSHRLVPSSSTHRLVPLPAHPEQGFVIPCCMSMMHIMPPHDICGRTHSQCFPFSCIIYICIRHACASTYMRATSTCKVQRKNVPFVWRHVPSLIVVLLVPKNSGSQLATMDSRTLSHCDLLEFQ
jgi:hypothetical protein